MGKLRLVTGIVIAVIVAVAFTTGAGAARKTGCPSGEWTGSDASAGGRSHLADTAGSIAVVGSRGLPRHCLGAR